MEIIKHIFFSFSFLLTCIGSYSQENSKIEKLKKECSANYIKNADKCISLANEGIKTSIIENDSLSLAYFEHLLGGSYYFIGDYNNAAKNYFAAIKILELKNDKKDLGFCYNDLAKLYRKTKKLNQADETYTKALNIFNSIKDSASISMIYNESGVVYEYKGDYKEALNRYKKSLDISTKLKDKIAISYALNNIAGLYGIKKDFKSAHNYLIKALNIRKQLRDTFAIVLNYNDIGTNLINMGDANKGIKYLDSCITISEKMKYTELQSQILLAMSSAYENLNKPNLALKYHKDYLTLKDSIFTKESDKQLSELNIKYQTEKKDLEISKNKAEIENEKNKRYITYGALAFFILLFSLAIWAFIQKRKNNRLLEVKNSQLEHANNEISHQKNIIEEKQKEIVDSINYAKKIQNALLASEEMLLENSVNHFILFKPKDIVSGDFTWATKHNNCLYLACCDSTGHGVPGAFMSLLNIGFLSEAIKERNIHEPGKIFDYVRDRLIETIGKDDQKDGFDGILICMDLETKKMTYAAAHNAPLLISNNEIITLSADKMPVGKGVKEESFKTHIITLQPGDSLYLYTDGYPDQFGGPKGKKFKYKQLEELLINNSSLSLNQQHDKLITEFDKWKGNLEQVDDVCIVGIKF